MPFNVDTFRTNLTGDGARANLFDIQLPFPAFVALGGGASQLVTFQAKAAQLPGTTIGMAPLYYFGREVKLAGNRQYQDWTIQIINDENFFIRSAFEQWANGINDPVLNTRNTAAEIIDGGYGVDATVTQYGKDGSQINQYQFIGIWPTDVSPIELDWGQNDAVEEFTVTLAVQYFLSAGAGDFAPAAV
jgi:T4-like virus tail tube protein gp19